MLHLLSDNYLIPILLFLALAFDLTQVSLQNKHKITRECNDVKNPTVMCLIRTSLSFPSCCCYFLNLTLNLLSSLLWWTRSVKKNLDTPGLSPTCLLCVCVCSTHASRHIRCWLWPDWDASGTGCVSQSQLHILLKSRFARVFQTAPSLVNRTRVCRKETELHLELLTAFSRIQCVSAAWISELLDCRLDVCLHYK